MGRFLYSKMRCRCVHLSVCYERKSSPHRTKTDRSHYSLPSALFHPPRLPLFHLPTSLSLSSHVHPIIITGQFGLKRETNSVPASGVVRTSTQYWTFPSIHHWDSTKVQSNTPNITLFPSFQPSFLFCLFFFSRLTIPQVVTKRWLECRWLECSWTNQFVLSI